MTMLSSAPLPFSIRTLSRIGGAAVVLVSALVLIGWKLDIEPLKRVLPGLVSMNPVTAVTFILSGTALWLLAANRLGRNTRRIAKVLAGAVVLLGLLKIVAITTGWVGGVDQLLFRTKLDIDLISPSRMAPTTAFNFVLIGLALLLIDVETRRRLHLAQSLALLVMLIALLAVIGYLYGVGRLTGFAGYIPMALHTAISFLVLSVGLLMARPDRGLMAILTSNSTGGIMARRLLPAAILIPTLLGWLRITGQQAGLYSTEVGVALSVVANIILFLVLLWWNATLLLRVDAERKRAQEALQSAFAELEQRVAERTAELRQSNELLRAEIGERKHAEEALRLASTYNRSLIEASLDPLVTIGPNGKITDVNAATEAVTGCSRAELIGTDFSDYFTDPEKARAGYQQVFREGLVRDYALELEHWDGHIMSVLYNASVYRDDKGNAVGAFAAARDITARKRAEEALRESEEKYRAFFEEDLTAAFIATPEGKILACNPAFVEILGFASVEEAMSVNATSLYPSSQAREDFLNLLRTKRKLVYHEMELRRRDGKAVYGILNSTGKFNEKGELVEIKGYLFDDTKRRTLEQQFLQAQKMEAVGRLAGGIAHDFNNYLTAIIGYSDLLLMRLKANDPLRSNATEIRKAGERATTLTRQLLAFSRKQILQTKVLNLNSVVTGMKEMLQRLIGEDIELVSVLDPSLDNVKADLGQIEQVILNLAINSRDAMPGGGKLIIETANIELDDRYTSEHAVVQEGPYVLLALTDTGHGMDAQTKAHLFEPFFTTKEEGKGTGLGLSTVYGIVKQSGGYIWVYSEPGHGTTFKIYLPRIAGLAEEVRLRAESSGSLRGEETILLVEDEASLRKLICQILQTNGYHVLEAAAGEEALEICKAHGGPIHLMVTDVVMPGMSGARLAEGVLSVRSGVKILYMSGYTDNAIVHHGILEPGLAYLQKPFTPDSLSRKVREVLDAPPKK